MPPRKRAAASEPLARLPEFNPATGTSAPLGAPTVALTPTEERRERELEEVLSELGTDGRITVYHVIEGKASFAGTMTLDGFSLETLLDTFGGGDKSLVIYQGKTKVDTVRVSLDPSIPPRNPKQGRLTPVVAPAPNAGLGDMAAVLASMAQMSMNQMAASQQMMTGMVGAITAMMTARPERDPMDTALKMAEIMGGNKNATPAAELFSVFEKGMNVAAQMGGKDDDGTLGIVKEGLGIIGKVVETNAANAAALRAVAPQRQIPRRVEAPPVGLTTEAGTPANDTTGQGNDTASETAGAAPMTERLWVATARPSAALLLMMIGNVSPETAASAIADRLPEEAFGDLLDDIEQGTVDEFLARFETYFNAPFQRDDVREWMRKLVAAVVAMVEPEAADDAGGVASES